MAAGARTASEGYQDRERLAPSKDALRTQGAHAEVIRLLHVLRRAHAGPASKTRCRCPRDTLMVQKAMIPTTRAPDDAVRLRLDRHPSPDHPPPRGLWDGSQQAPRSEWWSRPGRPSGPGRSGNHMFSG